MKQRNVLLVIQPAYPERMTYDERFIALLRDALTAF